ncbi:MAG: DUF3106 domain-containing protein [Pseudomonadota bacterium]|nr:DUF3106 domain-containing protein [Pseudomonadota bacterium]
MDPGPRGNAVKKTFIDSKPAFFRTPPGKLPTNLSFRFVVCLLLFCAGASLALPPVLSPPQRIEWRRREAALNAMTPAQRAGFSRRIAEWDALPEWARRDRRERALAWRALPAAERAQVALAATVFATLPPEQQQALRSEFDALDGRDRHGWLLGPVLGADYPRLQSLLSYVPAGQQPQLLQVLRSMSAAEREDLAVLAQRTPPEGRDALRRALSSTAAGNRSAWLQSQLDR